jgi:hypothetical protein
MVNSRYTISLLRIVCRHFIQVKVYRRYIGQICHRPKATVVICHANMQARCVKRAGSKHFAIPVEYSQLIGGKYNLAVTLQ